MKYLSTDRVELLGAAAALGDSSKIKELLKESTRDIDSVGPNGATALFRASKEGHAKVCRLLLKAGADPNRQNLNSTTPLMVAAQWGRTKVLRHLLLAGADPMVVASRLPLKGMSALALARAAL